MGVLYRKFAIFLHKKYNIMSGWVKMTIHHFGTQADNELRFLYQIKYKPGLETIKLVLFLVVVCFFVCFWGVPLKSFLMHNKTKRKLGKKIPNFQTLYQL